MPEDLPDRHDHPSFRTTLVRVLVVQLVALALLALLQIHYDI